jgi:hypothetical protein
MSIKPAVVGKISIEGKGTVYIRNRIRVGVGICKILHKIGKYSPL